MFLLYITPLLFLFRFTVATSFTVNISTTTVRTVSNKFLSVTLDGYQARFANFSGLNFTFIQPLAIPLQPAYFRFGGTFNDNLLFTTNNTAQSVTGTNATNMVITFTAQQLDQLYEFAQAVGWRLTFDLNILLRNASGGWNSTNPRELISYANSKNYTIDFELGNEPENFPSTYNINLTGSQIAQDFKTLRSILKSYSLYSNSTLFGPSNSASPMFWWDRILVADFAANINNTYLDAYAFHHYYKDQANTTFQDFLNATLMDSFLTQLNIVKQNSSNFSPLWLSETSTFYNGGVPGLSNSYLAGFLWLDKLGLSALNGVDVVARQTLYGGSYALLNSSMMPYPDYWLSVLYKRLVGTQVYNVTAINPSNDTNLRLYASSASSFYGFPSTAKVIYGVRLTNDSITLSFPQFTSKNATVYLLKEAQAGYLQSKFSTLNGNLLQWTPGQNLPNFVGNVTSLPVTLPGYSQFFIVINN